ncbi:MAG: hypothetical protein LIP03_07895 [Bacteroidales bacterium]|nr:hypothetical protein [Bacteroidales bacterium]
MDNKGIALPVWQRPPVWQRRPQCGSAASAQCSAPQCGSAASAQCSGAPVWQRRLGAMQRSTPPLTPLSLYGNRDTWSAQYTGDTARTDAVYPYGCKNSYCFHQTSQKRSSP